MNIRAVCELCGTVRLDAPDITLRMCIDTHDVEYRFTCWKCGLVNIYPILNPVLVDTLRRTPGIHVESWYLSPDLFLSHDEPPLTEMDVELLLAELDRL